MPDRPPAFHGAARRKRCAGDQRGTEAAARVAEASSADLEAICLQVPGEGSGAALRQRARAGRRPLRFLEGRETRARPLNVAQRAVRFGQREPKLVSLLALCWFTLGMGFGAPGCSGSAPKAQRRDRNGCCGKAGAKPRLQLRAQARRHRRRCRLLANLEDTGDRPGRCRGRDWSVCRIGLLEAGGARLLDASSSPTPTRSPSRLSPDGDTLAVSFTDQSVRWYGTKDFWSADALRWRSARARMGRRVPSNCCALSTAPPDRHRGWYENQVSPRRR
jgi:hypothetical protein